MRNLLLASSALVATIMIGPANAADLRVKAPLYKAPPPPIVYNWTGCYVGGLWAHKDWTLAPPDPVVPLGSHDANSWLGGLQAGCDYQFAGNWVVGIQGDYAYLRLIGRPVEHIGMGPLRVGIAGDGDGSRRLCLESLPRLRQGWRCLGARRLHAFHSGHSRNRLDG